MAIALGIDLGTQGAKALVVDAVSGRVLGRGAAPLTVDAPRPGAAEQDPDAWLDAVTKAVRAALAVPGVDPAAVAAIGVSGQQHGCVALDAADRPVRAAKLWCDTECATEARELSARVGQPIPAGFTAPKLSWMKSHEPANFARTRRVLLPHDWVNLFLAGDAFTDAGDASGTGYFDPVTRSYDRRTMDVIDPELHAMVPRVVAHDVPAGRLRAAAAGALGLGAGIPVAAGSGDNMMSALGAGAVDHGTFVVSLGTSGTLFGPSDRPVIDPEGLIAAFCDATGRWLPLVCTMNCTRVTEEVRACFGMTHEHLTSLAAAEPAGSGGVTFLPYLQGERSPDWPDARAAILGLGPGSMRPGRIYRAALEGTTLALLHGAGRLAALGMSVREVRVVGGGSRNPLWLRIIADAFGVPVIVPGESESAACGAALQAAAAAAGAPVQDLVRMLHHSASWERVEPDPTAAREFRARSAAFDMLGSRLFGGDAGRGPVPSPA